MLPLIIQLRKKSSWPPITLLVFTRFWCTPWHLFSRVRVAMLGNGFLGHLDPKLPHLNTSVKSRHGFGLKCIKDDVHESKLA